VNLRVGSGMQQAHGAEEEETVEVVRNHEGGTSEAPGSVSPKSAPQGDDGSGLQRVCRRRGSLENPEGAAWQQAERREMKLPS
jgi:hypothetical protein